MSTDHDSYDKKYIAAHAAADAPAITLEDETARFGVLQHDRTDLWEETAFALVAECGDHDVLMWTAGYLLKSNGRGVWIDKQAAEHDMMFIAVPRANRGTMSDNHFVRSGWHRTERLAFDDVKIERGGDRVVWQFEEQQFVSRPQAQPPGPGRTCRPARSRASRCHAPIARRARRRARRSMPTCRRRQGANSSPARARSRCARPRLDRPFGRASPARVSRHSARWVVETSSSLLRKGPHRCRRLGDRRSGSHGLPWLCRG